MVFGVTMPDIQDLRDDGMWMQLEEMGERPELLTDPFLDDEPLECEKLYRSGLDSSLVCFWCEE